MVRGQGIYYDLTADTNQYTPFKNIDGTKLILLQYDEKVIINKLKIAIKYFLGAILQTSATERSICGKPNLLSKTSAFEASLQKLSTEKKLFWLKGV